MAAYHRQAARDAKPSERSVSITVCKVICMDHLTTAVPRLLTPGEVLRLLRLDHVKTPSCVLFRLRNKGLPALRVGKTYKYPADAVLQYLQSQVAQSGQRPTV